MKKILLPMLTLAVTLLTACETFKPIKMDSPEALAKVQEMGKDIPSDAKVYSVEWHEGTSDEQLLSNNLTGGIILITAYKADGTDCSVSAYSLEGEWKKSEDKEKEDKSESYNAVKDNKPIDLNALKMDEVTKLINKAKEMIPDEYEFKSVGSFQFIATQGKPMAELVLRITEKGNETEVKGKHIITNYYELKFKEKEDGTLEMEEN